MTSATDELRRLLDERGVEWTVPDESWNQDSITYWKVGSIKWVAFESENGTLWLNCNSVTDLTPEQAIAATLGDVDATATRQDVASLKAENAKLRELVARMAEALGIDCEWADPNWCKSPCVLEFGCWPESDHTELRCPAWATMRKLGIEVDA